MNTPASPELSKHRLDNSTPAPLPPLPPVKCPVLIFNYQGVDRTLAKHPVIQSKLRHGLITLEQAQATKWYLRVETDRKARAFKIVQLNPDEAIREAKDFLRTRVARPNDFAAFLAAIDAAKGITIGTLAKDWMDASLPFSQTRPRGKKAADQLRPNLERALPFWGEEKAAAIKSTDHARYVVWRRQQSALRKPAAALLNPQFGSRAADLELAALSCLCQWAVKVGRLEKNPFEGRERFTDPAKVKHCHESMPANDEELHRLLSCFFVAPPTSHRTTIKGGVISAAQFQHDLAEWRQRVIVGAWLAFSALSGLRPGEFPALQRMPAATQFPPDLRAAPHGLIYPMPDGTRRMKVLRSKGGQNPAIIIHPALQDFLDHYLSWLAVHHPLRLDRGEGRGEVSICALLFPGLEGESKLNGYLRRACRDAKAKHMRPHGFGRAYYVRVRRSQGIDDSAIAAELGQKSDGELIRSVYGDPMDPVGGNLHDWLPKENPPAWRQLTIAQAANIIAL